MLKFVAAAALLPSGWARNVTLDIGDDGTITNVAHDADTSGRDLVAGPLVPAMPNLHSHAFQRAFAGRTGRASPSRDDSFWTWRQAMYAFIDRVDADAFEAIAAQAFVEMAKGGIYGGRRIPLCASRPAGQAICGPGGAGVAHRRRGAGGRARR